MFVIDPARNTVGFDSWNSLKVLGIGRHELMPGGFVESHVLLAEAVELLQRQMRQGLQLINHLGNADAMRLETGSGTRSYFHPEIGEWKSCRALEMRAKVACLAQCIAARA